VAAEQSSQEVHSLDAKYVLDALLKHNYLPAHKGDLSEVPPTFSGSSLEERAAQDLADSGGRDARCGYDSVTFLSTRFNNVPRALAVPHPVAHSRLSLCIRDNWESLKAIETNENSFIRPRRHRDGRLFTMDYESGSKRTMRELRQAFGERFVVHADISNCYPSIYTHSIPWAALGRSVAKTRRGPNEWFNALDKCVRDANRSETHGIVIGPGTSSVVAEFILGAIDEALRDDFTHSRFVDDYQAFCATEEDALDFVRRLSDELRGFNLSLNARKTAIRPLPCTNSADWVHQLSLWAPSGDVLSLHDVVNYLDLAHSMSAREPDGSVLKYAIKAVRGQQKTDDALFALISYTFNLALHNPVLVPLLGEMFDDMRSRDIALNYGESILCMVERFARSRCADGLSWALYYAENQGVTVSGSLADEIVRCGDCLTLAQLRRVGCADARRMVREFADSLVSTVVDEIDKYELDQYWVLLYELFVDRERANPYANEDAFDIMSAAGIRFLH